MRHIDHLLCVADDRGLRESRCGLLESSEYHSVSASIRFAEILLSYQVFDLIILSLADGQDLDRLVSLARGSDILVLDQLTRPEELLSMVTRALDRRQRKLA